LSDLDSSQRILVPPLLWGYALSADTPVSGGGAMRLDWRGDAELHSVLTEIAETTTQPAIDAFLPPPDTGVSPKEHYPTGELEQISRVVGRTPGLRRDALTKAEFYEIEPLDECIYGPNRILLPNIIFNARGQKLRLVPVGTDDVVHCEYSLISNFSLGEEFLHSLGSG